MHVLMHNGHSSDASRETTTSRVEPLDHFCGDRRGKKRHQSIRPTIAQSTGGQPRLQRARSMFKDELVIRSSSGFELTLRGRHLKASDGGEPKLAAAVALVSPTEHLPAEDEVTAVARIKVVEGQIVGDSAGAGSQEQRNLQLTILTRSRLSSSGLKGRLRRSWRRPTHPRGRRPELPPHRPQLALGDE